MKEMNKRTKKIQKLTIPKRQEIMQKCELIKIYI